MNEKQFQDALELMTAAHMLLADEAKGAMDEPEVWPTAVRTLASFIGVIVDDHMVDHNISERELDLRLELVREEAERLEGYQNEMPH